MYLVDDAGRGYEVNKLYICHKVTKDKNGGYYIGLKMPYGTAYVSENMLMSKELFNSPLMKALR